MDADFLALYGIDLETRTLGARRFLALASRTPAYEGVMAVRLAEEQQTDEPAPRQPGTSTDQPQEVSVDQMALMFPGLITRAEV